MLDCRAQIVHWCPLLASLGGEMRGTLGLPCRWWKGSSQAAQMLLFALGGYADCAE